jgi:hydrogenase maturation protease
VKTLVVGVGSTIRGDDGVGVIAARRLRASLRSGDVDVIELGTGGLTLLDHVAGYDRLIVLDAIASGGAPGTVHVLAGDETARAAHLGADHEADLPTSLAVGKKLLGRRLPREVFVVAIEAASLTDFSEELTPDVEAAVPEALRRVELLLGSALAG